jgi:regulatory protein
MFRKLNDEFARAHSYLLRLLNLRPRSTYEAKTRLQARGFSSEIIEKLIAYAEVGGLLDDEAFARLWIEERKIAKPKGRFALEQELRAKGIDPDIIARSLKDATANEELIAHQLAKDRLARYAKETPENRQRKLGLFLRRRGFSLEIIAKVLKALDD